MLPNRWDTVYHNICTTSLQRLLARHSHYCYLYILFNISNVSKVQELRLHPHHPPRSMGSICVSLCDKSDSGKKKYFQGTCYLLPRCLCSNSQQDHLRRRLPFMQYLHCSQINPICHSQVNFTQRTPLSK